MNFLLPTASLTFASLASALAASPAPLRFNRDIRPILAESCFHCHGQDAAKRKADLRLDSFEGASAPLKDGPALVPGQPEASAMLKRMASHDPDEQMPPPTSNRKVTPEQIALVRQWIAEGAAYEKHWAFIPPARAPLPAPTNWDRQPWDAWIRQDLARENLTPSPEATPAAWLRRASFDLTGFAATPAEVDAFTADVAARGDSAYSTAADRLLGSPRYGERMTADWLDAARYADTHGFNNDSMRSMWRWRDWVIQAFNRNLPYDQFITRQLAGDLLPDATVEDHIATGFCRNHVINSEGGIIAEEYRTEYVADRVRTLGMTWLGLTMECSRCHDHKYDPITSRDYYQLYAFFNQTEEWGEDGRIANAAPILPAPTGAQQEMLASLSLRLAAASVQRAPGPLAGRPVSELISWLQANVPSGPLPAEASLILAEKDGKPSNAAKPSEALGRDTDVALHPVLGPVYHFPGATPWTLGTTHFAGGGNAPWTLTGSLRWEGGAGVLFSSMAYDVAPSSSSYGAGMEIRLTAEGRLEFRQAELWPAYSIQILSETILTPGQWHQIAIVSAAEGKAAGLRLFIDGQESAVLARHDGLSGKPGAKPLLTGVAAGADPTPFHGDLAQLAAWPRALEPDVLTTLADRQFISLAASPDGFAEALAQLPRLQSLVQRYHPDTRETAAAARALASERLALQRSLPTVMVMNEISPPRTTHVLLRGNYDSPGEAVSPGVPESLLGAWPAGAPKNRLGLAQWLTKPDHPLTARVTVNRFWQQIFGIGLVKTAEDFGIQSEYPPHPELLDWLAKDLMESGWNVKALLRSIVLSATYRQDSRLSPDLKNRDPENRLLGRGPRLRLPAEMIRDHALAASGLLHEQLGGPSVYPDQPPDLYKGVVVDAAYPGTSWTNSTGGDLSRRSLYTFWKRTVPHPVMNVFDVPDREFGCVRRSRTNTPLQALTLMNEPALLRAAGQLGLRLQREGGPDNPSRLAWGFRLTTGRAPTPAEAAVLSRLLGQLQDSYQSDAAGPAAMLESGSVTPLPDTSPAVAAAWMALASNLLNLDETLTKN
jgi:mono/diheme cytochrome c family protein